MNRSLFRDSCGRDCMNGGVTSCRQAPSIASVAIESTPVLLRTVDVKHAMLLGLMIPSSLLLPNSTQELLCTRSRTEDGLRSECSAVT
jgi:hypothetical protein